jgi:hypothetical protein
MNSLKSIMSGLFVYLAGSLVTILFLGVFASSILSSYPQAKYLPNWAGPSVLVAIKLLFVLIGGFVAGRIAVDRPVWHGFVMGGFVLFWGLIFERGNGTLIDIVPLVLIVPLASWGASIAKLTNRRG